MWYDQQNPGNMSPNELRLFCGRLTAELDHKEREIINRCEEIDRITRQLNQRDTEVGQQLSKIITLEKRQATLEIELKYNKKTVKARIIAFIISIFFGATTLLFNYGNSLLTSKPPDPNGHEIITIAAIIFFGCTIVSVFIAGGSNQ